MTDQASDLNGAELFRLVNLYGAPDFVKSANKEDLRGKQRMEPAFYGYPQSRLYPLHTKAATWASYGFFLEHQKSGGHRPVDAEVIEERILHAGKIHGIPNVLNALKEASQKNIAGSDSDLSDNDFAIVWRNAGAPIERHMPIRNSLETVKAAEWLHQHRDMFPFAYRHEAAEKICEKVASYGVLLDPQVRDFIHKQAGYGACTSKAAVSLIENRVGASRRGPGPLSLQQAEMQKFAEILRSQPSATRDPEFRVKIASVVDRFDRDNGLAGLVKNGSLPRVEDVLFSITQEKVAAVANEHTSTINGSLYRLADIERLKLAAVRDVLGDDIADAMTADGLHIDCEKSAALIPTLDRGVAALFEQLMEDAGLSPAAKQASDQSIRIENSFLHEIRSNLAATK